MGLPAARETCVLCRKLLHYPGPFTLAEPAGSAGLIGKEPEHCHAKKDCRQPLEQEQPLPAPQPGEPAKAEQPRRQDAADNISYAPEAVKTTDRPPPVRGRVPARNIVHAGRPESRFGS